MDLKSSLISDLFNKFILVNELINLVKCEILFTICGIEIILNVFITNNMFIWIVNAFVLFFIVDEQRKPQMIVYCIWPYPLVFIRSGNVSRDRVLELFHSFITFQN